MTQSEMPDGMHSGDAPATPERASGVLSGQLLFGSTLALCAGLAIAWIDTRPHWDDTGVTAGALVVTAARGALARVPPWLAAALVAGPLVVAELSGGTGVLLAIRFAVVGAYVGKLLGRRTPGL